MPIRFAIRSTLSAAPDDVWRHVSSPEGVAYELRPIVKMTFPSHIVRLTPETVPMGERLCRSWILLGGVVPVDYDDVTLVELEPGRRFLERSRMATQRVWAGASEGPRP